MATRSYAYVPDWEFNSEDSVEHPWGDFVMPNGSETIDLVLDGRLVRIHLGEPKWTWLFIHRDRDGKIDHLVPVQSSDDPTDHMSQCELCSPKYDESVEYDEYDDIDDFYEPEDPYWTEDPDDNDLPF